ncbi:MAG: lysozyme [Bryobacteraceae bacterium]
MSALSNSGPLKAGPAAYNLIKQFEGLQLTAYLCPAHVWTIGWGHTAGVKPGDVVTEPQAEALLAADIAPIERDLPNVIHAPLTQGQFDALVSLCFNLRGGAPALPSIASKLVADLNAGDAAAAANEFLDIDKANGQVLPGLVRRRQAERQVFLSA